MTTKWPGGFITASPTAPSSNAASGVWTIEQAAYYPSQNAWPVTPGQQAYTSAGTYSWVAPTGVNSVCAVVVGPGGSNGGSGGALAYYNNLSVTPGQSYDVRVASGGSGQTSYVDIIGTVNFRAGNGTDRNGQGGGNGGVSNTSGGGAGGYSGNGGRGGNYSGGTVSTDGSGGGGGGGSNGNYYGGGGGGGGVGLLGEGANGTRGANQSAGSGGGGGSGGANGSGNSFCYCYGTGGGNGGAYGGGAGNTNQSNGVGARGAVRIIWGAGRAFPSTNTGDL